MWMFKECKETGTLERNCHLKIEAGQTAFSEPFRIRFLLRSALRPAKLTCLDPIKWLPSSLALNGVHPIEEILAKKKEKKIRWRKSEFRTFLLLHRSLWVLSALTCSVTGDHISSRAQQKPLFLQVPGAPPSACIVCLGAVAPTDIKPRELHWTPPTSRLLVSHFCK